MPWREENGSRIDPQLRNPKHRTNQKQAKLWMLRSERSTQYSSASQRSPLLKGTTMSHFATINTQIKDINAPRSACAELGLTLTANSEARGYLL